MFDRLTIRRHNAWGTGAPVDLGLLAEALVFYQTTHVVADYATLDHLFKAIGPHLLLQLLDRGDMSLAYTDSSIGIRSDDGIHHQPCLFTADKFKLDVVVPRLVESATGHRGKGSLLALRMLEHVRPFDYPAEITTAMRNDARLRHWTESAVAELLRAYAPTYVLPTPLVFQVDGEPDLTIRTNVDFDEIHRLGIVQPSNRPAHLTAPMILAQLAEATATLHVAAERESELSISPVMSQLVQQRLSEVLARSVRSTDQISTFFDEVLFEGPGAIRDAINSDVRSFADLVALVGRVGRFKTWLVDVPANANLAIAYYRELAKDKWFEGIGARAIRYIVMLGLGQLVGAFKDPTTGFLASAGLAAADTFLLDKLMTGWTPNQFVDGALRPFVSGEPVSARRKRNREKAERRRRKGR